MSAEHPESRREFSTKELLEGSHFEGSQEEWERQRQWIVNVIDRDGSILDIGCANGYLLKSLQEWSDHELDPYGVDIEKKAIEKARQLFPNKEGQFIVLNEDTKPLALPEAFDFVYWNVWDNADFNDEGIRDILERSLKLTSERGQLILGFYHPDSQENERRIQQLKNMGINAQDIKTPEDLPERGVIVDQRKET